MRVAELARVWDTEVCDFRYPTIEPGPESGFTFRLVELLI